MSVGYDAVGGIGIEVTPDIRNKLCSAYNNLEDDMVEILEATDFTYSEAGDGSYTGDDNTFYIMVEGKTLGDIIENAKKVSKSLSEFGISISDKDFVVIEDIHVW